MNAISRGIAAAASLILTGCSTQASVWGQYWTVIREGYRNSTGGGVVTLEQATAIPYASLAYRVDGSSEQILVLATDTNGDQVWTAASRVVLLTRNGRIVRSVGLPHDRNDIRGLQAGAVIPAPAMALRATYRDIRQADFPDIGLYSVSLNCVAQQRGRQVVNILGTAMATTRIDERCESQSPRWSFTDSYWLDTETGFVWQSVQHLHPKGPAVHVKILRPPE